MSKKILYITNAPRLSKIFWSIRQELDKLLQCKQYCLNLANYFPHLPPEDIDETFSETSVQVLKADEVLERCPPNRRRKNFPGSIKKYLRSLLPSVVVVSQDQPGTYQDIVEVAFELGIPSVVIQEAIMPFIQFGEPVIKSVIFDRQPIPSEEILTLRELVAELRTPVKKISKFFVRKILKKLMKRRFIKERWFGQSDAKYIGVTGDYYRRKLIRQGVKPQKIEVIGYARGDFLLANKKMRKEEVMHLLDLPKDGQYILFMSQDFKNWGFSTRFDHTQAILECCQILERRHKDLYKIVMLHPGEKLDEINEIFKNAFLSNVLIKQNFPDILALLENSLLVIGFWSTTLIETMMVQRPVLTLDYVFYEPYLPNMLEFNAVIPVMRREDLEDQLIRAVEDKVTRERVVLNQSALLKDLFDNIDGKVGLRAAKLICRALE